MGNMFKDMKKFAQARGWDFEETRGGYVRWTHPKAGKNVVTSHSPGDFRAILNFKAEIKRIEREFGLNTVEIEPRVRASWQQGLQAFKDAEEKPPTVIVEVPPPSSSASEPVDAPLLDQKPGNIVDLPMKKRSRTTTEPFVLGVGALKNGAVRQTVSTMCCMCSEVKEINTHSAPGEPLQPNSQLAATFRAAGWRVGVLRKDDMCPKCVELEEATRPDAPQPFYHEPEAVDVAKIAVPDVDFDAALDRTRPFTSTTVAPAPTEVVTFTPPAPQPERPVLHLNYGTPRRTLADIVDNANMEAARRDSAERRRVEEEANKQRTLWRKIIRAIDKAYVDARTGYATGESDLAIAERFGVDVEDVAAFREEHFGPDRADSATRDVARELVGLKRDLKNFQGNVIEAAAALETRIQKLLNKMDKAPEAARQVIEEQKHSNGTPTYANGTANGHANGEVRQHAHAT